ncbi:enzymatic polyprotein endonuclease reverse [Lasius niger]|uniref:RNA-directed DNA polymerase n=1 Tax=Lasius niger TaxID=67767 RepID=A0A0J7K955_LASNI|nr:enzymatic polyprotein endonuclease reverse [Lasius niger]
MPDPSKLTAIKNCPTSKKVKDIHYFIGLAGYYRKFIEGFSRIAKPLTILTNKSETFVWTTEQQNAFDSLKEKLMTAPVLKYPDFSEEFNVTTAASDYMRSELCCHRDRLFNVINPGSRLMLWRLKLKEYDYEIIYKGGQANANADALSRHVIQDVNKIREEEVFKIEENSEIADDTQKIYTEEEKQQILYECHDAPTGGHQGIERTIRRIRLNYNWPGITKDVADTLPNANCAKKINYQDGL